MLLGINIRDQIKGESFVFVVDQHQKLDHDPN